MVSTYWKIGKRIVEQEQNSSDRAEYGTHVLQILANGLTREFGKGFDERRLRDYRQFYLYFNDLEIWHSRVPNLSWTHFRTLLRVSDEAARIWYLNEASTQQWSVRTLDRNVDNGGLALTFALVGRKISPKAGIIKSLKISNSTITSI